jgi:hypothetical protein
MENLKDVRISDMRKMFPRWSHGTLYNRLVSLNIKDNGEFMSKNKTSGIIQYNSSAVRLLEDVYLKEFTNNTEADRKELDNYILSFLSSKDVSRIVGDSLRDQSVKNDNVDNKELSNGVNIEYINKNYVSKEYYRETINELNNIIAELKEELQKEKDDKKNNYITKEQHNEVVEIIKEQLKNANEIVRFKEQKDLYIEQRKTLGDGSEKMSWWRRLFTKKENNIEQ